MRRVVIEFPHPNYWPDHPFSKIRTFQTIHLLKLTAKELAALITIEFNEFPISFGELFPSSRQAAIRHELLDEDNGFFTYFVSIKPWSNLSPLSKLGAIASKAYLAMPLEIKDEKLRLTLIGSSCQIREALGSLDKLTRDYSVVMSIDARFPQDSPLEALTQKQRDVLVAASELGYYDQPRKIGSEELARKMNIAKSTLIAHRRKAEKRLLAAILKGEQ